MLARTIPLLKKNTKLARCFGKKMSNLINVEDISEDPDYTSQTSQNTESYNYNREEYPQYEQTIQLAQE